MKIDSKNKTKQNKKKRGGGGNHLTPDSKFTPSEVPYARKNVVLKKIVIFFSFCLFFMYLSNFMKKEGFKNVIRFQKKWSTLKKNSLIFLEQGDGNIV